MSQDLVGASKDDEFHYYPVHYLMSVLDDPQSADDVIAEVLRAGVAPEDVHTWYDDTGARALDADGRFHGVSAQVWRWAERATGEHQILRKYDDALHEGHVVVAIHCEPAAVKRFVGRLQHHHAREIRYFAAGGIETIADGP